VHPNDALAWNAESVFKIGNDSYFGWEDQGPVVPLVKGVIYL
jgi:hypothetical protein